MKYLLLLLVPLVASCGSPRQRAAAPAAFDLQSLINDGLASGKKEIRIPPGKYRVKPGNRRHLVLEGIEGVTIDASGVEMICTETTRAIDIINCRNLVIRGLTVDYDPLPFTQGRIVTLSEDTLVAEIELFDGYPLADKTGESKYEIFRPDTRTLRFGNYYFFSVKALSPTRIRITKDAQYKNGPEKVGDIIVAQSSDAPGGEIPHAIVLDGCDSVTLERITLYASNCFGFFEVNCNASRYLSCVVDRRPPEDDIKVRADPRIFSLGADAFNSKAARGGPVYHGCRARFQGDDCVAISGDYHMVTSAKGRHLRVIANQDRIDIVTGDRVELVTYAGARLPDAEVVSMTEDGVSTEAEGEFLRRQHMHAPMKAREYGFLTRAYRVTLDREVDLPMGSLICSANRIGNGFEVSQCDLGFNRSRGIIVKASNGVITGNRIQGCWEAAILLAPEYWWLSAGSSDNVRIENNTIENCRDRAIAVHATGGEGTTAPAGAHNGITIRGNHISGCPNPLIRVTSTTGLVLRGNRLVTAGSPNPVELVNCEDVDTDLP